MAGRAVAGGLGAGLLLLLLVSGAQGHAVMRNPHPRTRLSVEEVATFPGVPDAAALSGCGGATAGAPTATYRPRQTINVTYEVTLEHSPAPGVRLALRYPGGDFQVLEDENQVAFVDRTESFTAFGVHTVEVRLPDDDRTCEGPNLDDLCQLQWVIISEAAHDGGGYSIGCADVQISTTADVDHGYGPPPPPPPSGGSQYAFVQTGNEGSCEEQDNQVACEHLSDSRPVYKRCTWMEQLGVDGSCVDAGFEWTNFRIMCAVAIVLIVIACLYNAKKHHSITQDMNLKAVKTAEHLDYTDPADKNQPDIGQPNRDAHHSTKGLVPRALPALPEEAAP